jgi:GMP synthase-like glutamine amidotransferase
MPRYGIIHCYEGAKWWPIGSDLWRNAMREGAVSGCAATDGGAVEWAHEEWAVFDAHKGELPPLGAFDGVIITGSHSGAYDDEPWIHALAAWIRAAASGGGTRILGGCFGHQLIALSLGGVVEPQGHYVLRAEELVPTPALLEQPWAAAALAGGGGAGAAAVPSPPAAASPPFLLRLLESHGDCVRQLPPGGVLLASSASCAVEMFAVGPCVGVQSHPEFDVDHVIGPIIWPCAAGATGAPAPRTAGQAAAAQATFDGPRDEAVVLEMLRRFLKGGRA